MGRLRWSFVAAMAIGALALGAARGAAGADGSEPGAEGAARTASPGASGDQELAEAERAAEQARREMEQAAGSHPLIARLARQNAELAALRAGADGVLAAIQRTRELRQAVEREIQQLARDLKSVQEKVEAAGLTHAIGLLLLRKRAELPNVHERERRIRTRQDEIAAAQLKWLDYDEQWADLSDPGEKARQMVQGLAAPPPARERDGLQRRVAELLTARRGYLEALRSDYRAYFYELTDLDGAERQLVAQARRYAAYIDERVLWVRSSAGVAVDTFRRAWAGVRWLLAPVGWQDVLLAWGRDAARNPLLWALALGAAVLLVASRRRVVARMSAISADLRDRQSDRVAQTVEAAGLTVLLAALWPGLVWYLAWRTGAAAKESEFVQAVGAGLRTAGGLYLVLSLLRAAFGPTGLVRDHFRMGSECAAAVRRHLTWLTCAAVPLAFAYAAVGWQSDEALADSAGRLAFVAAWAAFAAFLLVLLRPSGEPMRAVVDRYRGRWPERLRWVWYGVAVLGPVAVAVLAWTGYYYAARQLGRRLASSALVVIGALLFDALASRWMFVVRRRLAREEALRRKEEKEQEARRAPAEAGEVPVPEAPPEARQSIYAISLQARRFVRAFLWLAVLAGLWFIWAEVAPALRMLDRVELWSVTVGAPATGEARRVMPVTLASVALALVVVAMTLIAARNVPGLLEMAVLQRLPLDRGTRFAITTLSRYLILVIGFVIAFGKIGIGWAKVQWLVAAMTVGLGFGLQEVFANFVSGLIILLERPMRVGDTVTVGDVTGTVTRIQFRATTILDWDRKELVVPNKEFITGRLVNWTLSDTLLRMVFPVGIAYGSDTALAEEALLRVAREHPLVLDEPPPSVMFRGFGDSSLNFELRVFVPSMDSYMKVWHEVNREIDLAFRKAGIEIPFPQTDLHLRSAEAPVRIQREGPPEAQGGRPPEPSPPPEAGG